MLHFRCAALTHAETHCKHLTVMIAIIAIILMIATDTRPTVLTACYLISNCLCVSRSCLLLFVSVPVSVFLATAVVNLV